MRLKATKPGEFTELAELFKKFGKAPVVVDIPTNADTLLEALKTSLWPEAVPATVVVKDEPTKRIRASSIISSFVKQPIKGKKVLDFGCGEGHTTVEAQRVGADAIGYDIAANESWAKFSDTKFTTSLDEVRANAPYDVIILYDVVNHPVGMTPVALLQQVASFMSSATRTYIRFHPLTSPHGTHLYQTLNKAYAHLLFDEETLAALGGKSENTVQTRASEDVVAAGLTVVGNIQKHVIAPDPFFKDEFILSTIAKRLGQKIPNDKMLEIMAINFVDVIVMRTGVPTMQMAGHVL